MLLPKQPNKWGPTVALIAPPELRKGGVSGSTLKSRAALATLTNADEEGAEEEGGEEDERRGGGGASGASGASGADLSAPCLSSLRPPSSLASNGLTWPSSPTDQ